jgi:multidrug efflux pump
MRTTLGIAVFSGMLGVTIFGILFTPVFYYVIRMMTGHGGPPKAAATSTAPAHANHPPADLPASEAAAVH